MRRRPLRNDWQLPLNDSFKAVLEKSLGRGRGEYEPPMYDLIKRHVPEPKLVVEVGCAEGCWSSFILKRFPSVELFFGIDVWDSRGSPTRKAALNNFCHLSMAWMESVAPWLFTKAFPLRGTSHEWGVVFPYVIDLLFVDACHQYEEALKDLQLYVPKVRKGGLVLMHDIGMPKLIRAMDDYFGKDQWTNAPEANVGFKEV